MYGNSDWQHLFRLTVTDGEGLQSSTFANATIMKGKSDLFILTYELMSHKSTY